MPSHGVSSYTTEGHEEESCFNIAHTSRIESAPRGSNSRGAKGFSTRSTWAVKYREAVHAGSMIFTRNFASRSTCSSKVTKFPDDRRPRSASLLMRFVLAQELWSRGTLKRYFVRSRESHANFLGITSGSLRIISTALLASHRLVPFTRISRVYPVSPPLSLFLSFSQRTRANMPTTGYSGRIRAVSRSFAE